MNMAPGSFLINGLLNFMIDSLNDLSEIVRDCDD